MNITRQLLGMYVVGAALVLSGCGSGGGGGGRAAAGVSTRTADPLNSSFRASVAFGTLADGLNEVQLEIILADSKGDPLEGVELEFAVSGYSNQVLQPALTDVHGRTTGLVRSTVGEIKTVQAVILSGAQTGSFASLTTEFVRPLPNHYYVRQGGSDGNSGSAPLEAWASLEFAFAQLEPGATLHVGAGSYAPARMGLAASQLQPIHILADRAGVFTGDSGMVMIDATGSSFGILFDGASYVALRGFTIRGAEPLGGFGGGIWISDLGSEGLSLIDCVLFENTRGLDVQRASGLSVDGCSISNNLHDGIRIGLTLDISILNNLIYNNQASGINIVKLTGGLTVGLNTFHANRGPHIEESLPEGSEGSTAFVTGNLFTDGGAAPIVVSDLSIHLFAGDINLDFGNLRSSSELSEIGESIEADPYLSDADGLDNVLGGPGREDDDFTFGAASNALDAGAVNANQVRLAFSGSAATKTTSQSGLRDGQVPDGERVNLGFHYPVKLSDYRSVMPSDTRVSHAKSRDALIYTVSRAAAQDQWSAALDSQVANAGIKWLTHRLAPQGPEELMAALVDTGLSTELYVRHWNGRRWSDNLEFPVVSSIARADAGERGFDLVYERLSSDALFVYSNGDANPMFRSLSQGVWSAAAPVFERALGSGTVLWVELIPEAKSDRVALVALDDQQSLMAAVWDGSGWQAPILLGTQVVELREFNSFAAAWESLSGNLMVMWGFSVFAEQARWAMLNNESGLWSATQLYTNSEAVGSLIRMASDPGSDRIAIAWGEGNVEDDVVVSTWDGSSFTNTRELSLAGQIGQHTLQVGWVGKTGKAFAIYRNRNTNAFERARFDRFWKFETPVQLPGLGRSVRAEIISDAGDDFAEVIILDENGALFGFEVRFVGTGTVWTPTNAGLPIAEGLSVDDRTLTFSASHRPGLR